METVSFMVVIFLLVGFLRRLSGDRDRARRLGLGMPARSGRRADFLYFTGRRRVISKRTHAYSPEEWGGTAMEKMEPTNKAVGML